MLADPQSITDGVTNHSFTRTGFLPDGKGSTWIWEGSTPTLTKEMRISHQNAGKSIAPGANPVRRTLVQLVYSAYNSTTGKTEKLTLNTTFTIDPGTSLDAADAALMWAQMVDFLTTDAQLDDVLLGEI